LPLIEWDQSFSVKVQKFDNQHKVFVQKVAEYKQTALKENDLIISEILEFLVDWLIIHIKTANKKYANFMNKKGVR